MQYLKIILIFYILINLNNCSNLEHSGYYVNSNDLNTIKNNKYNKQQVKNFIGTPNIIPKYSPNTWYYIYRTLKNKIWYKSKIINQHIIKINFNKNDIIDNVIILNNLHCDINTTK